MAGVGRSPMVLCSAAAVLFAAVFGSGAVASADDGCLPGGSLSTTSGAALQNGGTYGIGAVVIAHFDAPVGDRGAAEQALGVSTSPPVDGAWHWVNDQTAHWRPAQYYTPGTVVTLENPPTTFTIGAS